MSGLQQAKETRRAWRRSHVEISIVPRAFFSQVQPQRQPSASLSAAVLCRFCKQYYASHANELTNFDYDKTKSYVGCKLEKKIVHHFRNPAVYAITLVLLLLWYLFHFFGLFFSLGHYVN